MSNLFYRLFNLEFSNIFKSKCITSRLKFAQSYQITLMYSFNIWSALHQLIKIHILGDI